MYLSVRLRNVTKEEKGLMYSLSILMIIYTTGFRQANSHKKSKSIIIFHMKNN
jgi:hypothetical protein